MDRLVPTKARILRADCRTTNSLPPHRTACERWGHLFPPAIFGFLLPVGNISSALPVWRYAGRSTVGVFIVPNIGCLTTNNSRHKIMSRGWGTLTLTSAYLQTSAYCSDGRSGRINRREHSPPRGIKTLESRLFPLRLVSQEAR